MAHRFLISQDSPALYITVVTKDRLPVFRTDQMKQLLCHAVDEARNAARLLLFAYVIMIDHLHLLTSRPSTASEVLRMLKGITARRLIDYLKENGHHRSLAKLQHQIRERNYKYSLWQPEKNVLPVFSEGMFMEKVNYIHQNPVRSGLAPSVLDYRWSSARIWRGCPLEDEPLSDGPGRDLLAAQYSRTVGQSPNQGHSPIFSFYSLRRGGAPPHIRGQGPGRWPRSFV